MKKLIAMLIVPFLLMTALSACAGAAGDGLGAVFEGAEPTPATGLSAVFERGSDAIAPEHTAVPECALFDEGVGTMVPAQLGNRADYAEISGWIIARGYFEAERRSCVIGYPRCGGPPMALSETFSGGVIPAGDAFIYLERDAEGEAVWLLQEPDDIPQELPLTAMDNVFYADREKIWYATIDDGDGSQKSIRTLNHKTNRKDDVVRLPSLQIYVLAMLADGGVLLYDHDSNSVLRWRDDIFTTLYEGNEPVLSVFSLGEEIWVELEREIGLLTDGALSFRIPGNIAAMAKANGQAVLLMSFPGSPDYDVLLLNDTYRAYVRAGYALVSEQPLVELRPDGEIVIWGDDEEQQRFEAPPASEWIPYGFYDVESAREGC